MTLPSEERPERELAPRPPDYVPMSDTSDSVDLPPAASSLEPAEAPLAEADPTPGTPRAKPAKVPHTRIGAAWFGVWAGVVVVILLIIFIGQNTSDVKINFLWMDGLIPTALALLIAGVGGAIIAMAVAAARIVQLRRQFRRRP